MSVFIEADYYRGNFAVLYSGNLPPHIAAIKNLERCGCRECFDLAWAWIDRVDGDASRKQDDGRWARYCTGIAIIPAKGEAELFIQKSYLVPMTETIPCPPR